MSDNQTNGDYLALIHVSAADEKVAEAEIERVLAGLPGYRATLGIAEFDPSELEVELDEALAEIEEEASEALGIGATDE